jgi:hypothetical protein
VVEYHPSKYEALSSSLSTKEEENEEGVLSVTQVQILPSTPEVDRKVQYFFSWLLLRKVLYGRSLWVNVVTLCNLGEETVAGAV